LRVAAFVDIVLFVWTLAMLSSYWIEVKFNDCSIPLFDDTSYWLFIETLCIEDPGSSSMRRDCTNFDSTGNENYPPGEELYHWRAIQACAAICCAMSFTMLFLLCFGARAPAQQAKCCSFDKRQCQEICIAFTTTIVAFSLGSVGSLYTADSFDPDAWKDALLKQSGITCDVTTSPGPAVPMAFLSVFTSVLILGVLACPGCHCLGCHEPGKCCAKCVDQSVDADGTSVV